MGCHLTDTRPVASTGKGLVLPLWYWAASSVWKFVLYVISLSKLQEIKMRTLSYFFFFLFQCSDKSCLRTPSLKKRVIDINLEGKKDSGMLKYIRHQVLNRLGHTLVGEVATQMLGQAATRKKMCTDHEARVVERTVVLECGLVQTCIFLSDQ